MLLTARPQLLLSATAGRREADRIRKERERNRKRELAQATGPVMFERADWRLFIDQATLPQKAGCNPADIGHAVVKELVDNALDEGATVSLSYNAATKTYTITDTGRGIEPEAVPRLFAVNRAMVSSKLGRRPLRGMLGNGLRVVMGAIAYNGSIAVSSRGRRQILSVDRATGLTLVEAARPHISRGTTIEISLPIFDGSERIDADNAITIADWGQRYDGLSRPQWYSPTDMRVLFGAVVSETATVGHVVSQIFGIDIADDRPVRGLVASDVQRLHTALLSKRQPAPVLGYIGADILDGHQYHPVTGTATIGGATIPFVVEVWAKAERAERDGEASIQLWVNRSPSLARLYASSASTLHVRGCTLDLTVRSAKKAKYQIVLSIIAPYLRLANDGKSPVLADFRDACNKAINRATAAAYRLVARPPRDMYLKDAAWQIMEEAYRAVAENPGGDPPMLPANARQIMYRARPLILALTGATTFNDSYFTQHLLPDFIAEHPTLCRDWNVVYDARGHVTEPHTGRIVPLGTLAVRQYLGERPPLRPVARFPINVIYPNSGPQNRYRDVLFVEKEGFDALLASSRIAERFDLMIMSCKGMSVTAARLLIDGLAEQGVERVFVLHDFDVSGFSIAGTLTTDSRRYTFNNDVEMVDLGLRLSDIIVERLAFEEVKIKGSLDQRAATLQEHGATEAEIAFLLGRDRTGPGAGKTKRVELNAMASRQFIAFIERKLVAHGVTKVVPEADVISEHARRLIEQKLIHNAVEAMRDRVTVQARRTKLPDDIAARVRAVLAERPELSWDQAVAVVLRIET